MNEPWSVQVELTEGCNRMCPFCGIWGMWRSKEDRVLKFMSVDLATKVAEELNEWFQGKGKRIEFALQGEPLLNPNVVEIVRAFRKHYPKAQLLISTNGDALHVDYSMVKVDFIYKLFDVGLNYLLVENYDGEKQRRFFKEAFTKLKDIEYAEYYQGENVYTYHGYKHKKIVLMDDIATRNREKRTRTIWNHAGNVNFKLAMKYGVKKITEPLRKTCTNVFRELVVKHDGAITACCMDWNRELIVGKFPEESLRDIWYGEVFMAVRQLLYDRKRYITPCNRCDYFGGFRQGLIKNPNLPFTEQQLLEIITKAQLEKYKNLHGKYAVWKIKKPLQQKLEVFI